MRKRLRILVLAAIVAAIGVPLGFALSRESDAAVTSRLQSAVVATAIASTPVVVTGTSGTVATPFMPSLPDGAKLFFVGTVLVGVAAAMRRAA